MFIMIIVFVGLMLVADMICAVEVKALEIGAKGTIPCGHLEDDTEIRIVQWYKSRRIDMFVNDEDSLAWRTETETGSLSNFHLENTTFSLVIGKAMLEDEGLYKCSVLRGDLLVESKYLTRTVTYALPRVDPKITFETDLNRVRCFLEHVKPVVYPVLIFDWIIDSVPETNAVLNEDGTFTTSASCALPQTRIVSRVDCSFFFLHYQRVGSLDLRVTTTDSLMKTITTTVSSMTTSFAGNGISTVRRNILLHEISIGFLTVFVIMLILIMLTKNYQRYMQNRYRAKEIGEL